MKTCAYAHENIGYNFYAQISALVKQLPLQEKHDGHNRCGRLSSNAKFV